MPIAKKQLLRLIRLADLLKADRYPNCPSFARMMRKLDICLIPFDGLSFKG